MVFVSASIMGAGGASFEAMVLAMVVRAADNAPDSIRAGLAFL